MQAGSQTRQRHLFRSPLKCLFGGRTQRVLRDMCLVKLANCAEASSQTRVTVLHCLRKSQRRDPNPTEDTPRFGWLQKPTFTGFRKRNFLCSSAFPSFCLRVNSPNLRATLPECIQLKPILISILLYKRSKLCSI